LAISELIEESAQKAQRKKHNAKSTTQKAQRKKHNAKSTARKAQLPYNIA
jgi:hypothetical protein